MATTSLHVSFSLIRIKAKMAENIGPVVKLIQLLIDRGIYDIAEYYILFENKLKADLKNTNKITLGSYFRKLKSVPLTSLPKI